MTWLMRYLVTGMTVNDDDEMGFGSNLEVELDLMTFNVAKSVSQSY